MSSTNTLSGFHSDDVRAKVDKPYTLVMRNEKAFLRFIQSIYGESELWLQKVEVLDVYCSPSIILVEMGGLFSDNVYTTLTWSEFDDWKKGLEYE